MSDVISWVSNHTKWRPKFKLFRVLLLVSAGPGFVLYARPHGWRLLVPFELQSISLVGLHHLLVPSTCGGRMAQIKGASVAKHGALFSENKTGSHKQSWHMQMKDLQSRGEIP